MDYNHTMIRIGEVIDGAGVAVLVIGAATAAVAAAIRLGHHQAGSTAASARTSAGPSC